MSAKKVLGQTRLAKEKDSKAVYTVKEWVAHLKHKDDGAIKYSKQKWVAWAKAAKAEAEGHHELQEAAAVVVPLRTLPSTWENILAQDDRPSSPTSSALNLHMDEVEKQLVMQRTWPFGMHKNKTIGQIMIDAPDYFIWCVREKVSALAREAISAHTSFVLCLYIADRCGRFLRSQCICPCHRSCPSSKPLGPWSMQGQSQRRRRR